MRILLVSHTDWLKRNPGQQHHLAEMMSRRGHEVRVIDYEILWRENNRGSLFSRREVFNNVSKIHADATVTVIRPGIIKIPWLDYASLIVTHWIEIARQIKEFRPDVVLGFGFLDVYLAMRMAKKNLIPFANYHLDMDHKFVPFKPFQPIGKILESNVVSQADRVFVINDKLSDYVISLGASPERTQVLGAGINFEHFKLNSDGSTIRKQYGLAKEDFVLFFMGWLYTFSGLKEVAQQLAHTENGNLKLLIVGEGDAYSELQQIRERYNLQDRLVLTGKKTYQEIPAFIAASDVCLLPAYPDEEIMQDIVPIKMYEYMAMKKPVIATRLPGVMKEFGEDNGVVYIDKPEDVIIKATQLVQNGDVESLGLKARRFTERNSWDSITDEFERILDEVIEEKQHERTSQ